MVNGRSYESLINRPLRFAGILLASVAVSMSLACEKLAVAIDEDAPTGVAAFRVLTPVVVSEHPIGEVARVGDVAMSVNAVRATDGRDGELRVAAPPDGYVYLVVDVTMENIGDEYVHLSSRQQISLLDSEDRTLEWALFPAAAGAIDGRTGPGRERNGELTWRVLESAKGLKMVFGDAAFSIGDVSGYWPGSPVANQ